MLETYQAYLMENLEEALRLEVKTDPQAVREQALWCGIKPGLRVLDAGCGPGKVTSILHDMIQPGGHILGVDYSEARIAHAEKAYRHREGMEFMLHDLREPFDHGGPFDLIWLRFVLEYNLADSRKIVENLDSLLKPEGALCLLDLDYNCLTHYELPERMEQVLVHLMKRLEEDFNFDPYAGRKLYAHLYDLGYEQLQVRLVPHHLIYGEARNHDMFNWGKKVEVVSKKARDAFIEYPGGEGAFFEDFKTFFSHPRRFTYTPLIICKGIKPTLARSRPEK
jgi:SAM-dependent methyltransferase